MRQFATQLALSGFLVSILRGLFSNAHFAPTVRNALLTLVVFYGLGLACGFVWQSVFRRIAQEGQS